MTTVDGGEAVRFLKLLYAGADSGYLGIWVKEPGDKPHLKDSYWFPATDPEAAFSVIDKQAPVNEVYFHLALQRNPTPSNQRGTIAGAVATPGLWADLDWRDDDAHKKKNLPPDGAACLSLLRDMPFVPTLIVASGHGYHVYWLWREPWVFDDATEHDRAVVLGERLTAWLRGQAARSGWDVDSAHDLGHVFRLPGTINHKRGAVPVGIYRETEHRYNPSDFDEFLPELPKATNGHAPDIDNVAVNTEAEPPFSKFMAALENLPKFKATWERTRTDAGIQDRSNSGWDMALAAQIVPAGWTDQEITNLLIASRRKHHADTTLSRSYLEHTLKKARTGSEHYQAMATLETGGAPDDREAALTTLSNALMAPITGAIRRGLEGATYSVIIDGSEVLLGPASTLQKQSAVRSAIYDVTKHMFPTIKPNTWLLVCDAIAKVAELVDHPDGSPVTEIEGYVADYVRDAWSGRGEEPWQGALPSGSPFWREGRVWIHVDSLRHHLVISRGLRIHNADLRVLLGRAGFVGQIVSARPAPGENPVGRYYWRGPVGFPPTYEDSNERARTSTAKINESLK